MKYTKYPYKCIMRDVGKEFVPTIIDYENNQVWWQKSQVSDDGEWIGFEEVVFEPIKTFKI